MAVKIKSIEIVINDDTIMLDYESAKKLYEELSKVFEKNVYYNPCWEPSIQPYYHEDDTGTKIAYCGGNIDG